MEIIKTKQLKKEIDKEDNIAADVKKSEGMSELIKGVSIIKGVVTIQLIINDHFIPYSYFSLGLMNLWKIKLSIPAMKYISPAYISSVHPKPPLL